MFPKIGVPENGWFIVENPIKMDDLGVTLVLEIPKSTNIIFVGPWMRFFLLKTTYSRPRKKSSSSFLIIFRSGDSYGI